VDRSEGLVALLLLRGVGVTIAALSLLAAAATGANKGMDGHSYD
jgi:hypothetical protein